MSKYGIRFTPAPAVADGGVIFALNCDLETTGKVFLDEVQ